MPIKQRKRRIVLMSLSFFYKHGEFFVGLIENNPEENKRAWQILRDEIKEIYEELSIKFNS